MDENDLRIQKELAKIGINHTAIISLGIAILASGIAILLPTISSVPELNNTGSIYNLVFASIALIVFGYVITIAGLFWAKSRLDRVKINK